MMDRQRLVRFGAKLAARGLIVRMGLALAVLSSLFFVARALYLARREVPSAHYLPSLAAASLVWGAGICIGFGGALSALERDKKDGTFQLILARTGSARAYVWSRVGGLVALLALVNGGGALVVGVASVASAHGAHEAWLAAWTAGVSLLYGLCASVVLGLVCFAALGVAGRVGGYGRLLAVLALPELMRRMVLSRLDVPAVDVLSIEAALGALRESLLPDMVDIGRFVRAAFVLAIVALAALAVVQRDAARLTREGA